MDDKKIFKIRKTALLIKRCFQHLQFSAMLFTMKLFKFNPDFYDASFTGIKLVCRIYTDKRSMVGFLL